MVDLVLKSCDSKGDMILKYGEDTVFVNAQNMFKWRLSRQLTREESVDIKAQLKQLKYTIDKGGRRGRTS